MKSSVRTLISAQLLGMAALVFAPIALADIINPRLQDARQRLAKNPDTYDQVDQFCAKKKRNDACEMSGSTFAGGGKGVCVTQISPKAEIEMFCARSAEVTLDRQLPSGGYVADSSLCAGFHDAVRSGRVPEKTPWNCVPLDPVASDRFCRGRKPGEVCRAELRVDGKTEVHEGVCNTIGQAQSFYHQGHRSAYRQAIVCEPVTETERQFKPASWVEKLKQ